MIDIPVLSVSEISLSVKTCVEHVFSHVKVRGEVSDVKRASSGHIYFSLKDKDAVLSAICWRGHSSATIQAIQMGLEIVCTGKLSTYPGRSNYQMIVDEAEPAGIGALLKLLNERKERLKKEGLFDEKHKKKIPYLPEIVGVITSPTGSVIRDIIHRLTDRFPRHVLVWPVSVQGETCATEVTCAIEGFNRIEGKFPKPDVLIVARGGGSLEDLWGFNEECVVRAVYASKIPVISAVGHETDTTLIDYASDLRAPTPTGAAEKIVPMRFELIQKIQSYSSRLVSSLERTLSEKKLRIQALEKGLPNLVEIIHQFSQRVDDKSEQLQNVYHIFYQRYFDKVQNIGRLLDSYSYKNVLKRGFALISNSRHQIITNKNQAEKQDKLNIQFIDSTVEVVPLKSKKTIAETLFQNDLFS